MLGGEKGSVAFHGDHRPAIIYVDGQVIYEPAESIQEGTMLTFDRTYNDVAEVSVFGESVQDGTPAPDAPVPIESRASACVETRGRNLLGDWERGSISSATGLPNQPTNAVRSGFVKIDPDKIYTLTVNVPARYNQWRVYDENKNYLRYSSVPNTDAIGVRYPNSGKVLFGENVAYVRLCMEDTDETHFADLLENQLYGVIQLEQSKKATTYQPYHASTTDLTALLDGRKLRSLPDGTRDELQVRDNGDGTGDVVLVERCDASMFDDTKSWSELGGSWKLATPTETVLGTIPMPETFHDTTHIWEANGADISARVKVFG